MTRQQRIALASILALLLVGWAVKAWRLSQPGALEGGLKPGPGPGARWESRIGLRYAHTQL